MKSPKKRPVRVGQRAFAKRQPRGSHRKSHWNLDEEVEIPKRWVWHFETLSSLRERLIQERKDRLAEAAEPIEPHSLNQADSATDEFDHALALSRLSVDQDALYEVEAAMKRILDGNYGICEQSGRPIPEARLKVLPWTRYRKEAANRLERSGMILPSQLGRLELRRGESADSNGN